jgi:hypothetical protein
MKTTVPTLRRCRGLLLNRAQPKRTSAAKTVIDNAMKTHEDHAVRSLCDAGVSILSQRRNGRRLVLTIEAPPTFVRGAMCRRQMREDHALIYTYAAPWRGLQLEWSVFGAGGVEPCDG